MINSVIPTPEKHKKLIIPLENGSYSRKIPPTDSSLNVLGTETRRMKKYVHCQIYNKEKIFI